MTGQGIPFSWVCVCVYERERESMCMFPCMWATIYHTLVSKYDQHSLTQNDSVMQGNGGRESCAATCCSVKLSNQSHLSDGALKGKSTLLGDSYGQLCTTVKHHFCIETSLFLQYGPKPPSEFKLGFARHQTEEATSLLLLSCPPWHVCVCTATIYIQ